MAISEENFLHELARGNDRALEYVLDHYGWVLKSVLRRELRRLPDYYDECFNDCLLFLWKNVGAYDPNRAKFSTWMGNIARFRAIDYKRKYLTEHERREELGSLALPREDEATAELLRKEMEESVTQMLSSLGDDNRRMFWDCYVEDYGGDELSRKYGIPAQAVYSRLSRGRAKLRISLERHDLRESHNG